MSRVFREFFAVTRHLEHEERDEDRTGETGLTLQTRKRRGFGTQGGGWVRLAGCGCRGPCGECKTMNAVYVCSRRRSVRRRGVRPGWRAAGWTVTTKRVPEESREIKAMNDAVRQVHGRTFNEWFAPRLRAPVTLGPDGSARNETRLPVSSSNSRTSFLVFLYSRYLKAFQRRISTDSGLFLDHFTEYWLTRKIKKTGL